MVGITAGKGVAQKENFGRLLSQVLNEQIR